MISAWWILPLVPFALFGALVFGRFLVLETRRRRRLREWRQNVAEIHARRQWWGQR